MKNKTFFIILGAVVVVVLLLSSSMYIVNERQQVIVTQFGKPVSDPIQEPGLYFKMPFIQKANYFDRRYLEWDGDVNQLPTKDKRFLFIDTYARWEITEPLQFFRRLRDESGGQSRLDDILDGETRNAVANNDLLELVRSTNRDPDQTEEIIEELDQLEDIDVGKGEIESRILASANERAEDLGIRILDFRFKRINYVQEVRERVYERMISERNRIANMFRSEGEGEARRISGEKERELNRIRSEADREANRIRGKADAEASAIYANAYDRNNASRNLHKFLRTLESYEKTLDENTTLILSTDSDFYHLLQNK